MAFENLETNQFKSYLTKIGLRKLLQPGNNFNIKYFGLSDEGVNYNEVVNDDVLVTSVTANPLKTLYNGSPNLRLVNESVTVDTISKRELVFVRSCDNTEFRNAIININVGNYLQTLRTIQNNLNSVPQDFKSNVNIYDYVKVFEYTENAFNELKLWNTRDNNVIYNFNTTRDYNNYKILTNTFVENSGTSVKVSYDSNRFKSPFMLSFGTLRSETGIITENGELNFELYPVDNFGYLIDGSFVQPQFLTQERYEQAKNIVPVVRFLDINHEINTNPNQVFRPQVNNVIFRYPRLLNTSITAAKNMFEFYGNDTPNNEKVITINLTVTSGSDSFISKPAKLRLNFILDLNESNWVDNNILTIN